MLTRPYLTVAEFQAAPTYLDLDDLIVGGTAGQQTAELNNLLLRASAWCDNECNQPLGAHAQTKQTRAKADRAGRFWLHPDHNPVRQITAFSYGPDVATMTALTNLTGVFIEDGVQVMVPVDGAGGNSGWTGALQFGAPPPTVPVLVSYSYTAGYVATVLSGATIVGASALPLVDAVGIQPGDVLRLWEPSQEEAVTVAPSWVPVSGAASVPIVGTLTKSHASGAGLSGLPPELHQAIILVACAQLLGRGRAGAPQFTGATTQPTTSGTQSKRRMLDRVDVLLAEAKDILKSYKRVL